jgi:hypothetical protein
VTAPDVTGSHLVVRGAPDAAELAAVLAVLRVLARRRQAAARAAEPEPAGWLVLVGHPPVRAMFLGR